MRRSEKGLAHSWFRRLVAVSFLFLLSAGLSACDDPGLLELLAEFAIEWADQRQLISRDAEGNISPNYVRIGVYEAERRWTGTTGDRELDAALEVGPVVKSVRDADRLAEEGMRTRDPAKLDEAIAKRPGDWNYHDQKAAILGMNGNTDAALQEFAVSEQLVEGRINEGGSCRGLYQNLLRGRRDALREQLNNDPDNVFVDAAVKQAEAQLADLNANRPGNVCAGR